MTGGVRTLVTHGGEDCAITIYPDTHPADVMRAWESLPDGVGFVEAFGDVEVTLVFRPVGDLVDAWTVLEGLPSAPG